MVQLTEKEKSQLFWASFVALAATGVGFVFRVLSISLWPGEFNITQQQAGQLFGASLWPIAVMMILGSLVVDKIGYKPIMLAAASLQIISIIATFFVGLGPDSFNFFLIANILGGLGHGLVETAINPLCATMYRKNKTKMLAILHAAWPAGIASGGIVFILIDSRESWRIIFLFMLIPVIIYAIIFLKRDQKKFPVDERVDAGIGYKDMITEFGGLGVFLATTFVCYELLNQLKFNFNGNLLIVSTIIGAITGIVVGIKLGKGKWIFFITCLVMIPLATVELGTDAWIRSLMEPVMGAKAADWAIILSALIMMVLRFGIGIPLKYLSPLGLLLLSSLFSILGLYILSEVSGMVVFVAFVIYAIGQTFYWPTILGFVSEQFPKGGAMTLNTVSAMGLLTIGIFGAPFLGAVKDNYDAQTTKENAPALYEKYKEQKNFFGVSYHSIKFSDLEKEPTISNGEKAYTQKGKELKEKIDTSGRKTLKVAAGLPVIMAIVFFLMMLYYKSKGGYKPIILNKEDE